MIKTPPKIDIYDIANRLWETADELRANSHLRAAEYSIPVLGLIFLQFADSRFSTLEGELTRRSARRTTRPGASCISQNGRDSASCSCSRNRTTLAKRSTTPWPPSRTNTLS